MTNLQPADEPKKMTKFELQMEAAMKKKATIEEKPVDVAPPKKEKGKQHMKAPEPEPACVDPNEPAMAQDEDAELMYGAPDDVVWSDKSHALRESENAEDDNTHEILYGPDGKKLSNKDRKRLIKAKQAADREAEFEATAAKASKEGAQFACSQTAVNEKDPQWENSLDVNIPSFTISAAGKILFKDATLNIGHGRRYGLVGPNGRGESYFAA
jgi:ABC-type multidrug transport system fused ATPase/permease subunit